MININLGNIIGATTSIQGESTSTDSLSTLVENKDVEIKIELNNQKVESDVYGDSVFEIELFDVFVVEDKDELVDV